MKYLLLIALGMAAYWILTAVISPEPYTFYLPNITKPDHAFYTLKNFIEQQPISATAHALFVLVILVVAVPTAWLIHSIFSRK